MATISNLIVNMIARTSQFESGMKRSGQATKALQKTVAGVSATVRNMAIGFLAAAGVYGVGALLKSTSAAIDSTAKLSDAMGVSTEFLTGMQYAASIAGGSIEDISNAMKFLNKNMFEAMQGAKEQKDAFNSLGLSVEKLKGMNTEEVFLAVADSLSAIPNAAQRVNTALAIFGRGGANLIPLLMSGKGNIQALIQEAEKLGVTFSRFDAAKVEEMNDAFTRMQTAVKGIANSFVIYIAPYAQAVFDSITDSIVPLRSMLIDSVAMADRFEAIKMAAIALKVPFTIVRAVIGEIAYGIMIAGEAIADLLSWFEGRTGFGWIGDGWSAYSDGFYQAAEDIRKENNDLWGQIADDVKYAFGFGNDSSFDSFFDDINRRVKDIKDKYGKEKPFGVPTINTPDKTQKFQEINPSMINVAALYPSQNPVVSALNVTNGLLREIRDGELA